MLILEDEMNGYIGGEARESVKRGHDHAAVWGIAAEHRLLKGEGRLATICACPRTDETHVNSNPEENDETTPRLAKPRFGKT